MYSPVKFFFLHELLFCHHREIAGKSGTLNNLVLKPWNIYYISIRGS